MPDALRERVDVGSIVRVDLHGRRVAAWVVDVGVTPPSGVAVKPIARFSSVGPSSDVIELATWAAWRWAGKAQHFLTTASPPTVVASLASTARLLHGATSRSARVGGVTVATIPPADDMHKAIGDAIAGAAGATLVVCPSIALARAIAASRERAGDVVARYPRQWSVAASGAANVVIGARAAVWASVPSLGAVVVIDEHDEAHQSESAPTWHARDVAIERARRAGVACLLTSPCPTLEALAAADTRISPSVADARAGWPIVDIVDRRDEDPRTRSSLVSPALATVLASPARVACVLNTKGVARLLACASCRTLARCEVCDAAVVQVESSLVCARCGTTRPVVCIACGASRMKALRPGVSRLRAELEAATGEPVAEVTGATAGDERSTARVVVGTEAVLHQLDGADVVAFLDIDAELLAPRYRANEQVMALLARAARLVGRRAGGGRILVQTSLADHPVLHAATLADPERLVAGERAARARLGLPPSNAIAVVSGAGAAAFVASVGPTLGVDVVGPAQDRWLVRGVDHQRLCDTLAATPRPSARVRVEVDPLRV